MIPRLPNRRLCLSTVVLSAMWTTPAAAQERQSHSELQSLIQGATAQFQLAYRHDPLERQRRQKQLVAVVKQWRSAERGEANSRLLADWLRAAMRSSKPGERGGLPPAPEFHGQPKIPQSVTPAARSQTQTNPTDKASDDPFRDDPVQD